MKKFKNKKILFSLLMIFIIGLAVGIMFIFYIENIDKTIVSKELNEYIALLNNNSPKFLNSLYISLKNNLIYIGIIWISGIIFFFTPITYFIVFYKAFTIGFLLSCSVMVFKLKGILYFLSFIFPHEFLNILLIISLSIFSIKFSKSIYSKIKSNQMINIKSVTKKYSYILIIYVLLSILSTLLEVFVNYFLIKIIT